MTAVIYARKSSESEDRQVQSLDDQLKVLRTLSLEQGVSPQIEFVESQSAKDPYARPEFERLIQSIERGDVSVIYTWALNRLSRNPVDGGRIAHLLQTRRLARIVTPTKVYDSEDSPLLLAVENGMSTAFIQDLSRNVKRGLASKVEKGWAPCRAKIGYRNNLETHEIDIDPEAFPLLKQGWKLFLEGWTVGAIEDHLRSLGLMHRQKGKAPVPFRRHYFYRIIADPFYAGLFRYKGVLHKGAHQAMVSEAEFALAQQIMRGKPTRAGKHAPRRFLFGGIFRCATCGCAITAQTKRKYAKDGTIRGTYTYYHCTGYKGCKKKAVSEQALAEGIHQLVDSIALPSWMVDLAKTEVARLIERDLANLSSNASSIEARIATLDRRNDRLLQIYLDGGIEKPEYDRARRGLNEEKAREAEALTYQTSHIDRCMSYLDQQLQKCVRAHEFKVMPSEVLLTSMAQTLRGEVKFVPGGVKLQPENVLAEIIRFRPLIISSVSRETSDSRALNSDWQAFCGQLHTLARMHSDVFQKSHVVRGDSHEQC